MTLQAVISHRLLNEVEHYFQWDRAAARELLHFGGWIFLSTACSFLGGQADRLVIGDNPANLGSYNPAVQLAMMPNLLLYDLLSQFALPLYTKKLGNDGPGIRRVHLALATLAACLLSGLVVVVPTFAACIFPAKYHPDLIGWYAQLLAPGVWFTILQYQHETVLVAARKMRLTTLAQAVRLAALVPCMWVGYHYGGLSGFILGFKAPELLRYLILATATARRGLPLWRDDLMLTLVAAATCAGFLAVQRLYAADLTGYAWQGRWTILVVEAFAVVVLWALIALALRWAGRIDPFWNRAKEVEAC
jgi:O-antigen/teichoic acid export membrane protein